MSGKLAVILAVGSRARELTLGCSSALQAGLSLTDWADISAQT
jgi:hypothetical protein